MRLFDKNQGDMSPSCRAVQALRAWSGLTAPQRIARSFSLLFDDLPVLSYTPPPPGSERILLATEVLRDHKLLSVPFIRRRLIFDPTFTNIAGNPIWGIYERPLMGEDLARDVGRWKVFRDTLLDPLHLTDMLSTRIIDPSGNWIGFCAVFSTGARRFTELDRTRYLDFLDPLRDMVHACRTLAPADGAVHPGLLMASAWPEPAFAITDAGYILFMNSKAQRELPHAPDWLAGALTLHSSIPQNWHRYCIDSPRGAAFVFLRARTRGSGRFLDAAAREAIALPSYLSEILGGVLRGLTVPELAERYGKASSTIATYVERIRGKLNAHSRAGLTYRALEEVFREPDLWPTVFSYKDDPESRRST